MCGIAGVLSPDQQPVRHALRVVSDAHAPDGTGKIELPVDSSYPRAWTPANFFPSLIAVWESITAAPQGPAWTRTFACVALGQDMQTVNASTDRHAA